MTTDDVASDHSRREWVQVLPATCPLGVEREKDHYPGIVPRGARPPR